MPSATNVIPYICTRCLIKQSIKPRDYHGYRGIKRFSTTPPHKDEPPSAPQTKSANEQDGRSNQVESEGAMSRRLADMTEENLESGGRTARRTIEEAGFSEELKRQLEAKLQDSHFRNENPAAFAQLNMPSSAGKGTQQIASAQPWAGTETVEDAALRMLNDAHKPMRVPSKTPQPRAPSMSVDMRMKKAVQRSHGERLANARDRTSVYALSQDPHLTDREKEAMRKQLKERFTPGARPMPASVQGLAALANERIEDAIARGQFRNIARGKGTNVEKDYTASSPFLDTTEYFMNKIIQKQEIVPPWIEKQQELVKAAGVFRSRLRSDWKRHAARVIASKGGSLEAQVQRAEAYAKAEEAINPQKPKREALSEINEEGRLAQITVTEQPPTTPQTEIPIITINESFATQAPTTSSSSSPLPTPQETPPSPPFRDPSWLTLEHAYHSLAIQSLNTLTRSYNLQAPSLAQKPYFALERELRACFADVAPLLPAEIRERAKTPVRKGFDEGEGGGGARGVLERFGGGGGGVKVGEDRREKYEWRQFWRDLWG